QRWSSACWRRGKARARQRRRRRAKKAESCRVCSAAASLDTPRGRMLLSTRAVPEAIREERTLPKQSLLVVDADPRSQHILEVALRKAGFAVTTAADGAEALRKVQRSPPDLVLSELSLPGQDGVALCRALRGDSRLGGTPVVLMNADRAQPTR